jgi:hypothetical protein
LARGRRGGWISSTGMNLSDTETCT